MSERGRTYRLDLNTTGVVKGLIEAFGEENFRPQYRPMSKNYDKGMIIDHMTGESLAIVGEPKEELKGERQVRILAPGTEADKAIGKFIDACDARGIEVYPF